MLGAACVPDTTPSPGSQPILWPKFCSASWACSPVALLWATEQRDSEAPFNPKQTQNFWSRSGQSGWGLGTAQAQVGVETAVLEGSEPHERGMWTTE